MLKPTHIFYHADCSDGFGAAYAAWRHFGTNASYRGLHHGEGYEDAEIDGRDVFILDFSFPPARLERMAARAHTITQIDHHASARSAWAAQLTDEPSGYSHYTHPNLPLTVIFDLGKSGARLAWEHFHPQTPIPLLLQHIEDQDLWRFKLSGTRAFGRALRLQPFDFLIWHRFCIDADASTSAAYQALIAQGEAVEAFVQREIEGLAHGRLRMAARLRGEPVDAMQALRHGQAVVTDGEQSWLAMPGIAVNANVVFASELGHQLAEQCSTFGLIWQLSGDGEVKVSLRSNGSIDVSVIALRYGGGGHPNAAGFRLPLAQFMAEVLRIG